MALAVRVPVAFVAEDQFGDAPVRLEVAARLAQEHALGWAFTQTHQYGPLPMHLAALLAMAGLPLLVAARLVALAGGLVSVGLAAKLAGRFSGPRAAWAAGLALALSPLHIQASTTFVSEAVYLAFALWAVWAALEKRWIALAIAAFGATTTRYDAWVWGPALGLWWVAYPLSRPLSHGERGAFLRRLLQASLLAVGPASILIANALDSGHPFAPLTFISGEHVQLAARAQAEYGVWQWRLSMLGYWPAAMAGILTPGFAIALLPRLFRIVRERATELVPVSLGLLPPALYTVRSVVFGTFWPMARFALGPAALIAVAMPALRKRSIAVCLVLALATDGVLVAFADGEEGWGLAASASSPISRLPADLRAAAEAIRTFDGLAALDMAPSYDDIIVACASGKDRWNLEHPPAGAVPGLVVTLDGGALDRALTGNSRAFGATYRLEKRVGRATVWRLSQ